MDDADAALLRQRDGEAGLGDGVHRRRHDRDVERDAAAQLGAQVDLVGVDLGEAGPDQDVVEGESEREVSPGHAISRDRNEVDCACGADWDRRPERGDCNACERRRERADWGRVEVRGALAGH